MWEEKKMTGTDWEKEKSGGGGGDVSQFEEDFVVVWCGRTY